jgi:Phage integrase family
VTLPAVAAVALAEHLGTYGRPGPDGLVFTSTEGGLLRRSNFQRRVWRPATRAVGLAGLRFHDLRHTSATRSVAAGASTREPMARVGHSSSAAALRYQHVMAGRDAAIAAALDELIEAASALSGTPPSAWSGTRVARMGDPAAARSAAEPEGSLVACAVVVVELRGFEPLTPCMPSRDPGKSPIMKPRITSRHTEAVVVARGVLHGLVWAELLPRCCPPNDRELHVPRCSTTPPRGRGARSRIPLEHGLLEGPVIDDEDALRELLDRAVAPPQVREEILKAARTGRHARQLGSGAGRTKSRAGRPARRPRVRSG